MNGSFRPVHTGNDADIAFAVVVLASYFSTFSSIRSTTSADLMYMIGLGVAYIGLGIYGYALVTGSGKFLYSLLYFVVQIILGGFIIYLGRGVGFNAMVMMPLAGHSVVLLPVNWRLVVNTLVVAVYIFALSLTSDWSVVWASLPVFLAGLIFIIVFTQMAVNEEKARAEVEQLAEDLAAANAHLRSYALQAEELAISKERNRLAREIHDGLGHYLTTVYMQIQAARAVMQIDPERAGDTLAKAQNLAQEALVDVRQSVTALRDAPGLQLPLPDEVKRLLQVCDGAGVVGDLKVVGSPRPLSPPAQLAVFRAVQEGINNSCKHARAENLWVTLDYSEPKRVKLEVRDDGVGADEMTGGFGLLGMRERVNLLNGELEIITAPGNGFCLEVSIPG